MQCLLRMRILRRGLWSIICVFAVVVSVSLFRYTNKTLQHPLDKAVIRAGIAARDSGKANADASPISQSRSRPRLRASPVNLTGSKTNIHAGKSYTTLSKLPRGVGFIKDNDSRPLSSGRNLAGYTSILDPSIELQLNCSRCAYVSSSGQLQGSSAGSIIDAFPCIIRMNDAPTQGFEGDVGSKTTIRVVAFSSMGFIMPKKDALFRVAVSISELAEHHVVGADKAKIMLLWGPPDAMDATKNKSAYSVAKHLQQEMTEEGLKIFLVSPEHYDAAHRVYEEETHIDTKRTNSWLSTGWFTMLFAREACDEIHVFGMVPHDHCKKNRNSKVPYHYYQPKGIYECSEYKKGDRINAGGHHLSLEKTIFARWSKVQPEIFFNYPEWSTL